MKASQIVCRNPTNLPGRPVTFSHHLESGTGSFQPSGIWIGVTQLGDEEKEHSGGPDNWLSGRRSRKRSVRTGLSRLWSLRDRDNPLSRPPPKAPKIPTA